MKRTPKATSTNQKLTNRHKAFLRQREASISAIAARELGLETLEPRQSDSLDFHELSVWQIKAALQRAWEAGYSCRQSHR